MEEKKDNKLLIILVIVFGIVALCAVGYIVYDKCFNNSTTDEKEETNVSTPTTDNNEVVEETDPDKALDYIVANFPKTRDSEVTGDEYSKVFNLTSKERHEATFTFNYKGYKVVYNYVDGAGDASNIKVYNGEKEVYHNDSVKTYISGVDGGIDGVTNVLPTISNGKLHLVAYNANSCYLNDSNEKAPLFEYLQIDLTSNEIKVDTIKSVKFALATHYTEEGEAPNCE